MDHVRDQLKNKYAGRITSYEPIWEQFLRGRSVLDIGVVEHDLEFFEKEGWKHRKLKTYAKRIVGLDILPAPVAELNKRGYDVRLCDATSDADLGERFDVVYIGDVIEHVDNPVGLLRFAARHLADSGVVVATTPCPFWWRNIGSMMKSHSFIGNVDHIRWVCPVHALELAHRAGIELEKYNTIETYGHTAIRRWALKALEGILGRTELNAWGYVYIFKK